MQWFYLDANQQQTPADESELGDLLQSGTIAAETLLWNESMGDWESARELFPDWFPEAEVPQAAAPGPVTLKAPALSSRRSTVGLVKRPLNTGTDSGAATQKPSGSRTQRTTGSPTQRAAAAGRTSSRRAPEGKEEGEAADLVRALAGVLGARSGWIKFVGVMAIIFGVLLCLTVVGALIGWLPIWMGVGLFKTAGTVERAAFFGRQEDMEEALTRTGFFFKLNGIFIIAYIGFIVLTYVLVFAFGLAAMVSMPTPEGGMPENPAPVESLEMPVQDGAVPENPAPVEPPKATEPDGAAPVNPAPADAPKAPAE